jgi:hypothetical protein
MVVLDTSAYLPSRQNLAWHPPAIPVAVTLAALGVGFAGLVLRGFDENSLAFATQLVWRFNCLVFFAALVASPAGRLIPLLSILAGTSRPLLQGFCAGMAVYFGFILLPNLFAVPDGVRPSGITAGMTSFVIFTGIVTLVMAMAVSQRLCAQVGPRACRAILGVATIYFWLCYGLIGLAHISGPHRQDLFYELSVMLMVTGLLVRFADRFFENRNPVPAA